MRTVDSKSKAVDTISYRNRILIFVFGIIVDRNKGSQRKYDCILSNLLQRLWMRELFDWISAHVCMCYGGLMFAMQVCTCESGFQVEFHLCEQY